MPLLQLSAVSLAYGHVALLDRIDLVIEPVFFDPVRGRLGFYPSLTVRIDYGDAAELVPSDEEAARLPELPADAPFSDSLVRGFVNAAQARRLARKSLVEPREVPGASPSTLGASAASIRASHSPVVERS